MEITFKKNQVKPELLAPAGNIDILKAAIQAGADAIYCSGKQFGARAYAKNFTNDEIIEAANYVHLRNKKIYVTVNTIIFTEELDELSKYISFLYNYVDGVIVQDLGLMHYIRKKYPDFNVHISTQLNIHNLADAKFLQSIGVKRIVLAREVPLSVLEEIVKTNIETEIFVHGALCFAYSGNCYFSKAIGGRSGNRGTCAQPCRKSYSLYEDDKLIINNKSILSMKDLCTLENIHYLCDLGVTSFKIEGRMKSKSYVVQTVRAYRVAIDNWFNNSSNAISKTLMENLQVTFNREYTKGYTLGANNSDVVNINSVNHQGIKIGTVVKSTIHTATIKLAKDLLIHDAIRFGETGEVGMEITKMLVDGKPVKIARANEFVVVNTPKLIKVTTMVLKTKSSNLEEYAERLTYQENILNHLKMNIDIKSDEIAISVCDPYLINPCTVVKSDLKLDKTNKAKIEDINQLNSRIKEQFTKINKLPIEYDMVELHNEQNYYVPIPLINEIRLELLNLWKKYKEQSIVRENIPYSVKGTGESKQNNNYGLYYVNRLSTPNNQKINDVCEITNFSPRVDFNYDTNTKRELVDHLADLPLGGMISPYLNIANPWGIEFIRQFTNDIIYLSVELDLEHQKYLIEHYANIGIMVYSKFPVMISNHCVVGNYYNLHGNQCCNCAIHSYKIKDEYQNYYELLPTGPKHNCQMLIANSKIYHISSSEKFKNKNILIEFYSESEEDRRKILIEYKKIPKE